MLEAGIAVAGLIAEKTAEGEYAVHAKGVEEVVADKGYHSNEVMVGLSELAVRSYVAERVWLSRIVEPATEKAKRRGSKRYTAIGGACRANGASGCSGNGANDWNATLRISLIPVWTFFMCGAWKTRTKGS